MNNDRLLSPGLPFAKPASAGLFRHVRLATLGLLGFAAASVSAAEPAGFPAVENGQAVAVVVTSGGATEAVKYAAQELVYHVQKGTGVKLEVIKEGKEPAGVKTRIYLGDTKAAREAGINVKQIPVESFVLRTGKNALFIVGNDGGGDPLDANTSVGTLFGVYEWLERDLGVRWMWPGELGTFVPKTQNVAIKAVDVKVSPSFFQRKVRQGLGFAKEIEHPALGFTPKAAAAYAKEQTVFLRRSRMGNSHKLSYGHAFTKWWADYGKQHPEWFQLYKGKRGPETPKARFSMCVSNAEFQKQVVADWKDKGGAKAGRAPSYINVVENDFLGSCECDNCRAWDGPQPPDKDKYYLPNFKVYGSRYVSDRYARFALEVQKLAAKENPNVTAVTYAYFNYFQAPNTGIKLNPNILVGFCPSAGWYPRTGDEHDWYKKQWKGWRDTGARLFVRTNYFLDGYNMPFIFARQFADDFQFQVRNGMVATDFDSLTGQWSTQGPTLYLLMRLHTRPNAKVDDLLAEYYSGFGPAASQVKEYFDYWERYTMDNTPMINDVFADRVAIRWRTWAKAAHRVFPDASFLPADAILAKAAEAAKGDADAAARVDFLKKGLVHAKLSVRAASLLTLSDPESTPERGQKALEELLRYRRAHEQEWLGNFDHSAWVEDRSWKLSEDTKKEPEYYP